jgi:hypothetical protein
MPKKSIVEKHTSASRKKQKTTSKHIKHITGKCRRPPEWKNTKKRYSNTFGHITRKCPKNPIVEKHTRARRNKQKSYNVLMLEKETKSLQ